MFAQKYEKDGHLKKEKSVTDTSEDISEATPQYFVLLQFKILMCKFSKTKDAADFTKALAYLDSKMSSFGILLDF